MDTTRIKVLLTVLETGSLSAAAEKLGYTPSGISRQIAALEAETGLPLLRRQHNGATPTPGCSQLLESMHQMLGAESRFYSQAAALTGLETGSLCIGCAYESYLPYLAKEIADFSKAHPGIRVEIFQGSSSEISSAIGDGRFDLAVISQREGDFDWMPLQTDELLAVLPAGHPLAQAEYYPVEYFEVDDFIDILPGLETDNSRMFARLGLHPSARFVCNDSMAGLSMVEMGLGVTLVNALLVQNWHGNVRLLPLYPPQQVEIGIAVPAYADASPASAAFLDQLRFDGLQPSGKCKK